MAYLDEGDEVVISESSFPVYDIYTHVMRAETVKTGLKDYRLDLDAMADAVTPRTKMIFVCNPNNPTGTIVTADEVTAFMERIPDDVLVIFDEAYYEMVDDEEYPETLTYVHEGRKNVMITRTFSKVFGLAGVRLGYAIAAPEVLAPLNRVKEPFAVNLLAQAAGIGALEDLGFMEKTVAFTRRERRFLREGFEEMGLETIPSQTNFMLVKIGPDAAQVQEGLVKRGVIVRPCNGYNLPTFLRVTVGSREQNERLIGALEEVLGG
jgi:histidinol-phosphate aminotransferase